MAKIYLTPGPTHIHPLAKSAIQDALEAGVCSISHRSNEYQKIQDNTEKHLRMLLAVPEQYSLFFLSSGTEAWERIIQNGVAHKSFHLVNGSFSKRFYETAIELGKNATCFEKPLGSGFDVLELPKTLDVELICATHNETSSGVSLEDCFLEQLHDRYPQQLIAVDAVSSAPCPRIDFKAIDYYFFSVQKFFCLPAGLGVLIVSPRALQKAVELKAQGFSLGAHHSFTSLQSYSEKKQTPCTPNVLAIYTLGKVAESFNIQGLDSIREQTAIKAKIIYDLLDQHKFGSAFVKESRWRSKTVITVDYGSSTAEVIKSLSLKGFIVGEGYGKLKDRQLRIANFSAHSLECFGELAQELKAIAGA